MAKLLGRSIIGFREGVEGPGCFYGLAAASGQRLQPGFFPATLGEVELAAQLAFEAFAIYGRTSGREKGRFVRKIADNLEGLAEDVIERAHQETALPKVRLEGEMGRTCGQLRLFAQVVEEGSWVGARIDRAEPARQPVPKPDIRSMLRPLGPVAVFGASNFPLAFSVAGGDTASALAGGNPVIVKAHPAHPGTSELVGQAVRASVQACGLPEGTFSLLFDSGTQVAVALVTHPRLKAVGFTGSRTAGRALMNLAAARPGPIPFFGEMSSTNPVFVLPGALEGRGESIASGLHASFTLGAGQFCTKPGLVFVPQGPSAQAFAQKLRELVLQPAEYQLLTPAIRASFRSAIGERRKGLEVLAEPSPPRPESSDSAVVFETDALSFLENSGLEGEIFGPTTLLVHHSSRDQLLEVARRLEGHLTATIHGTAQDLREWVDLINILESKVGRLIFNGFPTGVEVSHAMVHGGPYPATSDGRSTSVGTRAIFRFTRPVCYQGFPDQALPEELKDANPLGIWRLIDGQMTRGAIASVPASPARSEHAKSSGGVDRDVDS
ncbi:MAG TPA: aldehyde dehydrogenase (NADP(+)) [Terriglobales bacterium]|nr:aldehyde dehydrogenase (NADP(+)) [Terriglobales bacterium]